MSLLFPGPEMTPVAMPRPLDGPWIEGLGSITSQGPHVVFLS